MNGQNTPASYVIDSAYTILSYNEEFRAHNPGIAIGATCYRAIMGEDAPCAFCPLADGAKNQNSILDIDRNIYVTAEAVTIPWVDGRQAHVIRIGETVVPAAPSKHSAPARVVSMMEDDYRDIYNLNLHTGQITVFRTSGRAMGVDEVLIMGEIYDAVMEVYISNNVFSDDQQKMRDATSVEKVREELSRQESFTVHYRVFRDGQIHYNYLKCVRAGAADSFENIIFGFANEDDVVLRHNVMETIAPGGRGGRRSILIVDGDRWVRTRLANLLRKDYAVLEASDGHEAMTVLREAFHHLSLILLDVKTPFAGLEFLERVKSDALYASVPVIMTAGRDAERDEEQCLSRGAADFILKPYNPPIVTCRIRSIIRLRESSAMLKAIEYDDLTGLYTKQAFFHYARRLLDEHPNTQYDLLVSDIENFKAVNAIYGVNRGDACLRHVATNLAQAASGGICGRYGGDQLVLLVEHRTDRDEKWFANLTDTIVRSCPVSDLVIRYGIYLDVDRSLSVTTMCDRAMLALRSIKHNYNRFIASFDDPGSKQRLRAQMLEVSFEEALRNEDFVIWYQPKFDVKTEKMVGMEALVRWKRPNGVYVSPQNFIPVFEEDGLITRLDEYVFRKVCSTIQQVTKQYGTFVPISINLSRASLCQEDTVTRYRSILDSTGIPAKYVPLELTESAMLFGKQVLNKAMQLRDAGFHLHLDDFGSGFSTLTSLNVLPLDTIKLDKSLIDQLSVPGGEEVLRHTIELAHYKNLQVIAEGVETAEQLECLRRLNCDTIQGYYFSGPEPYDISFAHMQQIRTQGHV